MINSELNSSAEATAAASAPDYTDAGRRNFDNVGQTGREAVQRPICSISSVVGQSATQDAVAAKENCVVAPNCPILSGTTCGGTEVAMPPSQLQQQPAAVAPSGNALPTFPPNNLAGMMMMMLLSAFTLQQQQQQLQQPTSTASLPTTACFYSFKSTAYCCFYGLK